MLPLDAMVYTCISSQPVPEALGDTWRDGEAGTVMLQLMIEPLDMYSVGTAQVVVVIPCEK
jgi:hypothetical protein